MSTKQTVEAAETGARGGDGTGTRTLDAAPSAPGRNVTTNAGRRGIGAPVGDPGRIRDGQGPSGSVVGTGLNEKTGVPPGAPIRSMAPRPSIPANQAATSSDLEKRLMARPQPFTYEGGAATLPTDRLDMSKLGIPYNVMADVNAKPQNMGAYV